ncbi:PREDICTED: uncharacterized protein LOC109347411 isoform X2 [Lupinus angustifolius]|uniref:uncharacterized protein LOC109347411 isoform X2 n=1 Tax=Lupinus angustifolius TaxID=3871 RepID=UPI00092F6ACD|nr:PREDICTED: uncharacterized protein LOC109347411 isoform X2 [Lupinus angustifolius]
MRISGGVTVCSGHRFLPLPNLTRPQLTNATRSRLVTVHLKSNGKLVFIKLNDRLKVVTKASDSSTTQSSSSSSSLTVPDDEFSISKVSFGVIGLSIGVSLLSYGFGAYFNILPGSEWSAIMLTYGFPLAIIGMALKVKSDVIRYRYGDEQHLEEALKRIFQYGQGGGIPRRSAPVLEMIREEVTQDGKYSLVLVFKARALKLSDFEQRQAKFTSFFGPGVTAEVGKGENDLYEVRLISNTDPNASPS